MRRIALAVPLLVVIFATIAVQPAQAASVIPISTVAGTRVPRPGGRGAVVVSDTGWAPISTYFEMGHGACGGIVGGNPKDQNPGTREERVITFQNGDMLTRLRGSVTLSVGMVWDGWLPDPHFPPPIDVLVSGAVTRVDYASGAVYLNRTGPGVIAAHTVEGTTDGDVKAPETAAFIKAGLTNFYVLREGTFTEYVRPNADTAKLTRSMSARLMDVCDLIGQSDWPNDGVYVYESAGIGGPIVRTG